MSRGLRNQNIEKGKNGNKVVQEDKNMGDIHEGASWKVRPDVTTAKTEVFSILQRNMHDSD